MSNDQTCSICKREFSSREAVEDINLKSIGCTDDDIAEYRATSEQHERWIEPFMLMIRNGEDRFNCGPVPIDRYCQKCWHIIPHAKSCVCIHMRRK